MNRYILGPDAAQDVDDIWEYIASDNIAAADRLIAKLFDAFENLAKHPGIGHSRKDLTAAPVLFWPLGNYLVIYRSASDSPVEIVAIVQGNRDIPAFLSRRD